MKRMYALLVVLIGVIGLFGCESSTLGKPDNLKIVENTLTWDAVKDAESYVVIINNQEYTVTATTFDLSSLNLSSGNYNVYVVAKKGTTLSLPSTSISYTATGGSLMLSAPIIQLTGHMLSWQPVTNATGYQVIVNGQSHPTTETTFDLSTLNLAAGSYSITVKATAGTALSQASAPKNYAVISVENRTLIYGSLMNAVNPRYVANMKRADFENDEEYNMYVRMDTMVNLYLDVAIAEGMSGNDMVSMLTFMVELPMKMAAPQPTLLKTEFDKLGSFGLTPDLFTSMIMTLGDEAMRMALEEQEAERTRLQASNQDYESALQAALANANLKNFLLSLKPYVESYDLDLFNAFTSNAEAVDLFAIYYGMTEYANYLVNGYGYEYMYGEYLTNEYIFLFERILWNAYYNNNQALVQSIANRSVLDSLYDVALIISDHQMAMDQLESLEIQIEMMSIILEMMSDQGEELRVILLEVTTYIKTLYNAIPMTMLSDFEALIQSEDVSMAELMIFKDEVVQILIDTLPTETSFKRFYETLMVMGGSMAGYDVTSLLAHSTSLAKLDRTSILLGLEFLLAIEADDVNAVIHITNGMFVGDYGQAYVKERINPNQVVELIMYVLEFMDEFVTEQKDRIDTIKAIDMDAMVIDYMTFAVGIAKTELQSELSPEQFAQVSELLDVFLAELPTYIDFYQEIYAMDVTLIKHILDTNGQMLRDLATFMSNEAMQVEGIFTFVEQMIDHVMDYRGLIRSEFDEAFITKYIQLIKVPMMGVCIQGGIDDDCDGLFEAVKPGVIDLMVILLDFEEALMTELDAVTNVYTQIETWQIDLDLGIAAHVIISFDRIMDAEKSLFIAAINTIIDDILTEVESLPMFDINLSELAQMKQEALAQLEDIDAELDRLAALNFSQLTENDVNDIRTFISTYVLFFPVAPVR
ncbi:fibronectin type III domain-containing protein [Methanobacterium sp. YSL]|nr:fibronectin type III domain-containing protein [Methanobacterium sp. YSL]